MVDGKLFGVVQVPSFFTTLVSLVIKVAILYTVLRHAYNIRTFAIQEYGNVIHEFDPWFNFRATQYLESEGWSKFFTWFDYMSWYPLGRPVGTTIYPGMQIVSVLIYRVLNNFGIEMSLNDVCVYVPVWFGVVATTFLGMLTWECSGSTTAGVIGAAFMSIIPAHVMRSVGGGYDNESVAITAMTSTFFFWVRSLRSERHWPVGIIAGLFYVFMVAAWGGYVFVVNLIGLHAGLLALFNVLTGRHSTSLYLSYSLFYVIGTFGATHVPVVGWNPIKSLEQSLPLFVFICFQLLELSIYLGKKRGIQIGSVQDIKLKTYIFGVAFGILFVIVFILLQIGFFGPLSARVRGLFVKHTRTGNPLVDSVAEHQPASAEAFHQYLHIAYYTTPFGVLFLMPFFKKLRQSSFLMLYALVAYFFSTKMTRLLLLAAPMASSLSGIAVGCALDWCFEQLFWDDPEEPAAEESSDQANAGAAAAKPAKGAKPGKQQAPKPQKPKKEKSLPVLPITSFKQLNIVLSPILHQYNSKQSRNIKLAVVAFIVAILFFQSSQVEDFRNHAYNFARQVSNPMLVFKARLQDGKEVIINDYRLAYWWLRDNTPRSSRVMAWWDYGYQITGIGNRTTIADGNTWNHEHIATLGYCLTSPTTRAHDLIRHLADYVLVWSGGGGDDLAKSPHMARIANSVYNDLCPSDPTCAHFGFYSDGTPTPMMAKSLLYNLIGNGMRPGAKVDSKYFQEVYTSPYRLVRIYKVMDVSTESKKWVADPANRKCDAPGSWYCSGQYPPAEPLQKLLAKKRDFKQLEDFNRGNSASGNKYYEEYMANMEGRRGHAQPPPEEQERAIDPEDAPWENTPLTTKMWNLIKNNELGVLQQWLQQDKSVVYMRSEDGRGPLWWAYEMKNKEAIELLKKFGAKEYELDKHGKKPKDLA